MVTNPGFEYDTTPSYSINIVCTDSNGEASTAMTLTVNILPNTPPTISGLPTSVSVNDGEDGPLKIYDITVTDAESDSFICSLSPAGSPFNYQSTPGLYLYLHLCYLIHNFPVSLKSFIFPHSFLGIKYF